MNTVGLAQSPQPTDLVQLAQRIRGGDREAERELVLRYRKVVFAMVRRRCRPGESQVEDLVQDVLTAMIQRLRREEVTEQALATEYLRATIHHRCLSFYRTAIQRNELHPAQLPEQVAQHDALGVALAQERARQVRALIDQLPQPRDREILRLFYLDQLEREDICARLEIDAEHFRRVLHRARQRMLLHIPPTSFEELLG